MSLHVLSTVNCGPKALFTEGALVRLRAHVCGHVPREAAIGGEGGIADAAAECLDSCVNRQKQSGTVGLHYPQIAGIRGPTNMEAEEFILLTASDFDWMMLETMTRTGYV